MGVAQLYHDRGSYTVARWTRKNVVSSPPSRYFVTHAVTPSIVVVRGYIESCPRIIRFESHFLGKPMYEMYIIFIIYMYIGI